MARFRSMKTRLRCLLQADEWQQNLGEIVSIPPRESTGALFSVLLFGGEMKWRAVTALGLVVAELANNDMEQARIIMRRFLWHMNEESGNVGWGIAESMAEVMANSDKLAAEYNRMLHSYIRETGDDDNFLDHPPLRCGVYWGIGRLAQARPDLMRRALPSLIFGLDDEDRQGRGVAAWALGNLLFALKHAQKESGTPEQIDDAAPAASSEQELASQQPEALRDKAVHRLTELTSDETPVELFDHRRIQCTTTGELAREAIAKITGP